jgi:hypothetical protein
MATISRGCDYSCGIVPSRHDCGCIVCKECIAITNDQTKTKACICSGCRFCNPCCCITPITAETDMTTYMGSPCTRAERNTYLARETAERRKRDKSA